MAVHRSQLLEVLVDLAPVAGRQPVADVGAQLGDGVPAGVGRRELQVGLQVGLAQALPRPVGEGGDGVGGQSEERGRPRPPGAPSTSVCHSTICQRSGSEAKAAATIRASSLSGGTLRRARLMSSGTSPGTSTRPSLRALSYQALRTQVMRYGRKATSGSGAPLQGRQHPGEGLRHQVVDVGAGGAQAAGGGPGLSWRDGCTAPRTPRRNRRVSW